MKKLKWTKRGEWHGHSYSLYLPDTDYIVAKIMTRKKTEYDIALPKKDGDFPQSSFGDAESEVIKRLKDISEDLQNLLK